MNYLDPFLTTIPLLPHRSNSDHWPLHMHPPSSHMDPGPFVRLMVISETGELMSRICSRSSPVWQSSLCSVVTFQSGYKNSSGVQNILSISFMTHILGLDPLMHHGRIYGSWPSKCTNSFSCCLKVKIQ